MLEPIIIFGAGGHAKVVIDAIEKAHSYSISFLVDADPDRIGSFLKHYVIRSEEDGFSAVVNQEIWTFVAIGNNAVRKGQACKLKNLGCKLAQVIHPAAVIATDAVIGEGTLVMPGSILSASVKIGANVIINSGTIIEHDCCVGDNCHIAPRATLCGGVEIGEDTLVGAGAIILPGVKIGARSVIGAGAVVLANLPDDSSAKGNPARS
jgi:sugar O-acyltransferase (sialic acid O-acetyltransferase NeuD family)